MSEEMTSSWVAAIDELAGDRSVRAVVVTGEGGAFCSGGNTSWIASEPDATVDRLRERMLPFYRAWLSIRTLEVPTIAAVNGPAIGAGLCLALACDIRYAAAAPGWACRSSSSACTPAWPGPGCCPRWSGRPTPATCCSPAASSTPTRRCGWAWSRAWSRPTAFLDDVLATAAGSPPPRRSRAGSRRWPSADGGHADLESALQWEALAQPMTLATADLQEGIAAAREKRAAGVPRPLSPRRP